MKYFSKRPAEAVVLLVCVVLFVTVTISGFYLERTVNSSVVYVLNQTDSFKDCNKDPPPEPDIDLSGLFPTFDFNASWISKKYFWTSSDFDFESRAVHHFRKMKRDDRMLKVVVVPHSHNDPGWLNTYEQYYNMQTKNILRNAIKYLVEFPEMTFVWSETTYLAKFWKEDATQLEKEQVKELVKEGRLELVTGGWVVPDEGTSSLYSDMLQLTEGQQWIHNNLNQVPKYSWAIDPFGHSATHAYLLKMANMEGMVTQRLHYVWKHFLAQHRSVDFKWRPKWDPTGKYDIPCLTLPYDLYSIKHACGPQPQVCLKFDFRNIPYEYGENHGLMTPITKSNLRKSAQELAAQYYKTASLTRHNVILVPLGDDFRYDRPLEWEQQYANYMQLFSYINSNPDRFKMEIGFGTLSSYFKAVNEIAKRKNKERETLSGDFFPYGDVYVSGKPAYWTGFYSTRPYWKKLHREVEHELRSAEILYTFANALAKQSNNLVDAKTLSYKYQDLITSRQDFAVFTHHDGITGTSRKWTMEDYGERLHFALQNSISIQIQSMKVIYNNLMTHRSLPPRISKGFIRDRFEVLAEKIPLEVFGSDAEYVTKITVFNSLGWRRRELVKILVKQDTVQVFDSNGISIPSQINPVFHRDDFNASITVSERIFELVFFANLEPLSFSTFKIYSGSSDEDGQNGNYSTRANVSCRSCVNLDRSVFKSTEDYQDPHTYLFLENDENKLLFDKDTGLLQRVELKKENKTLPVSVSFGFYRPVNRDSGAYLLKPLLTSEWSYFRVGETTELGSIVVKGPIMSQVVATHFSRHEVIFVNTSLFNVGQSAGSGILIENYVDLTKDYSNRVEAFMRIDTNIQSDQNQTNKENGTEERVPVMYTDQNSLVSEKRTTIPEIKYEGNTYPVTTMAYIQDEQEEEKKLRFSVLVDRTHGFCSMKPGRLETLIERKNVYDDGRGMSQGVTDSKPTVSSYLLRFEILEAGVNNQYEGKFPQWQPTLSTQKASLRLNYPPNLFIYNDANYYALDDYHWDQTVSLLSAPLSENVHLLNLRTLSQPQNLQGSHDISRADDTNVFSERAGNQGLLNLQYLSEYDKTGVKKCSPLMVIKRSRDVFQANHVNISWIQETSLTGVGQKFSDEEGVGDDVEEVQSTKPLLASYKIRFHSLLL